ncbi:DUF559 domain-containing protein [Sphingomonas sp.]|uniref:endonuclease domain-containing protein n=1 Tax=Sphingomonas sp. TaxID=28214 RepID=UPI00286BEA9F|nr:DUF559 domain-containing protein [Sphingomonas sp.]
MARARGLRRNMTPAERKLWAALRLSFPDHHWRKQVPFAGYTADFCSHRHKLIIEVDGGQHAETSEYDATRTRYMQQEGYRVMRFWNNDVMGNVEGVVATIVDALSPSPFRASPSFPLPKGEEK